MKKEESCEKCMSNLLTACEKCSESMDRIDQKLKELGL